MIPTFAVIAVLSFWGTLGVLFPNVFQYIPAFWLRTRIMRARVTRRVIGLRQMVVKTILSLIAFLGIIGVVIYYEWWVLTFWLIIIGVVWFTAAILMVDALRAGAVAALDRLESLGNRLAEIIPLRTISFGDLSLGEQVLWLLGSPLYGGYLTLALPLKGAAELAAGIGEMGPTLDKWAKHFMAILSGIALFQLTIATLILFQERFGLTIITLPVVGAALLITVIGLNLLYLGADAKFPLREFTNFLGWMDITLVIVLVISWWFPRITDPVAQSIQNTYDWLDLNRKEAADSGRIGGKLSFRTTRVTRAFPCTQYNFTNTILCNAGTPEALSSDELLMDPELTSGPVKWRGGQYWRPVYRVDNNDVLNGPNTATLYMVFNAHITGSSNPEFNQVHPEVYSPVGWEVALAALFGIIGIGLYQRSKRPKPQPAANPGHGGGH